jgi:seryl-tRNA synthetase
MLDIKYIRENTEEVERRLNTRGEGFDLTGLTTLDNKRRRLLQEVEALKQRRNKVSQEVGRLKGEKKDASALVSEMQEVSSKIKGLDQEVSACEDELKDFLLTIPNLPHPSVPLGRDETENPVVRTIGEKPEFSFKPKEHIDIGERLNIIDFERAGKLAGARFALMKGAGALLERALINFMLDLHTKERGYTELLTPFMVKW